ncbi:MAG: NADH:flavin oxidoreductase [Chloroflexi bacterium]|nr:NADH:flavin oxidoreductase [Chloroflexota bacterium]
MPRLFEPVKLGGLELKNRAVRSATWDGAADSQGAVTDEAVALFRELGRGQIGLIITGHAFVTPLGQGSPNQYGIHRDEMIPGLRRLTDAVHREGSKIAVQITHCGINSGYLRRQGITCQAVSHLDEIETPHKEMTGAEIETIIADFASAARRAISAGFDAIQLHGAHGFLMSEFLSPFFNRRTDKWGGSPENRRRFHIEVIKKVRREISSDFPLFIKLGAWEDMPGGLPLDEGIAGARGMVEEGLDALEISVGARGSTPAEPAGASERVYFRKQAAAVKKAVSVPVILVGGIRSLKTANDIIESGDADLISMSRPFIRQPDLLVHWQQDEATATCISCSKCFPAGGRVLECGEDRRLREEKAAVR